MPGHNLPPMPWDAQARLDRHLHRMGVADAATKTDAVSAYVVTSLRWSLALVEAALEDEGVQRDVINRVLDLMIYGGTPQSAEIEERQRLTLQHMKLLTEGPQPIVIVRGGDGRNH